MKGKKEDRWLPRGNQRDEETALRQKNQSESPIHDDKGITQEEGKYYFLDCTKTQVIPAA